MLLNNIELDVKTKCIEESITQAKIAEELGTTPGYIAMMEELGYDVRLVYEKREGEV